ncbi:uncharacterized protein LOC119304161 [Triticum dicoccoides]|uniref:uncharacterized protein LOC119304161 n=1 Tax=Triticum dicoccoides TaxID=85692 RepID=UPI00188F16FD|nr:uncharacterized protein LOC119304161 [Triticum dicoccoides]XP_037437242.1 uncharacterized protein LOC119304161 [Triticum dicoccoides]
MALGVEMKSFVYCSILLLQYAMPMRLARGVEISCLRHRSHPIPPPIRLSGLPSRGLPHPHVRPLVMPRPHSHCSSPLHLPGFRHAALHHSTSRLNHTANPILRTLDISRPSQSIPLLLRRRQQHVPPLQEMVRLSPAISTTPTLLHCTHLGPGRAITVAIGAVPAMCLRSLQVSHGVGRFFVEEVISRSQEDLILSCFCPTRHLAACLLCAGMKSSREQKEQGERSAQEK